MADMPNLEELLKQTSLRFAKSQSGAFILPFRTKSLGESVVWVGLSADG